MQAVSTPDAIVWIPESATIDMTGSIGVPIAPNVTIASNRSLEGGSGGLIKTTGYDNGLFMQHSGWCRITGLRLHGPRFDQFEPRRGGYDEVDFEALGFNLQGASAIIDHNEVAGWTFAGFALGAATAQTSGWIHHNWMHHNQMEHYGYPMELYNGVHLIEWNSFDYNRHSIAGFGYATNSYEARFNVVGPHASLHSFDMHYLGENLDHLGRTGRGIRAGGFVNIHHNVFELTSYPAFSIQGIPAQFGRFCNNWCAQERDGDRNGDPGSVALFPRNADVRVTGNKHGATAVDLGRNRLQEIESSLAAAEDSPRMRMAAPGPLDLSTLKSANESTG